MEDLTSSNILDYIVDVHKVLDYVDHWPDFHDAEIISIKLNRQQTITEIGPTLILDIATMHKSTWVRIELHFGRVERLVLAEFNYQNAINGLFISFVSAAKHSKSRLKVELIEAFGVSGSFQCEKIKVGCISPYDYPKSFW